MTLNKTIPQPPTAAVVGWPIDHARSPIIHNYWLRTLNIPGRYTRIAVSPDEAPSFFKNFRDKNLVGCNITVPHKELALAAADEATDIARRIGAANVLWLDGKKLCATNTDVEGFIINLDRTAPQWRKKDRPAIVLGAGGAARGIVFGLLEAGVSKILLTNRTPDRAEAVAAEFGGRVEPVAWLPDRTAFQSTGLVVNTTTLGMKAGATVGPPIDVSLLADDATVADAVYVPLMTPLLRAAEARGLAIVDGLGMLLYQAETPFEKFFGHRPIVTPELRQVVIADLEKDAP
jgi:shikimate dehydrogenase